MLALMYFTAVVAALCLTFGIILFFYFRRSYKLAMYLSLAMIFAGLYRFSAFLYALDTEESRVLIWINLCPILGAFALSWHLFFYEVFLFKTVKKIKIFLFFAPGFIFLFYSFFRPTVTGIYVLENQPNESAPGKIYIVIAVFLLSSIAYMVRLSIRSYKKTSDQRMKKNILIMGTGMTLTLCGILVTNVALPLLGRKDLYPIGGNFSFLNIAAFCWATFRYKLFEIKIIVQKSLIYAVIFSMLTGFYLFLLQMGLYFIPLENNRFYYLSVSTFVIIIGILSVPRMEKYFCRATDKFFFKDRYDYSQALYTLNESLSRNLELNVLMEETLSSLRKIFKINCAAIFVAKSSELFKDESALEISNPQFTPQLSEAVELCPRITTLGFLSKKISDPGLDKKLGDAYRIVYNRWQENNLALGVKIVSAGIPAGYLVLSPKLSGDAYTDEDIRLLETFSHAAAVAIRKAELYQDLKNYSKELEKKVAERTAKIKKLQENQSQAMIEIAHELQTPLAILKSKLDILSSDGLKTSQLEKSVDRISGFINNLLKLARMDFAETKMETANLSGLLSELAEEFSIIAAGNDISFESSIAPYIEIQGDKEKLVELVTNLVANALKYIANDRRVFLALEKKGSFASLLIKDTGIGIPRKEMPNLFQKFYRCQQESPAENQKSGTGLGLAICKKIVDLHKGEIRIESEEGVGTKVEVLLPMVDIAPESELIP